MPHCGIITVKYFPIQDPVHGIPSMYDNGMGMVFGVMVDIAGRRMTSFKSDLWHDASIMRKLHADDWELGWVWECHEHSTLIRHRHHQRPVSLTYGVLAEIRVALVPPEHGESAEWRIRVDITERHDGLSEISDSVEARQ